MTLPPFIDTSLLVMIGLIAVLAALTAWKHGKAGIADGLSNTFGLFMLVIKLVPFAMWVAILIAQVLPSDIIGGWLGAGSGVKGVAIAGAVGGLVPSGPYVSFPIAVTLLHAGTGVPQLVAFLTGWSVFALHRVFALEIPMMGVRFVFVRLMASLALPLIAGVTAMVLWPYIGP